MTVPLTIDATYEDGVLRPAQPLPLAEHERVRIQIQSLDAVALTYGSLGWQGDSATVQEVATSSDLDVDGSP